MNSSPRRAILQNEAIRIFLDQRFLLAAVIAVILPLVVVPVLVEDYSQRLSSYQSMVRDDRREAARIETFSELRGAVHRLPSRLSIFSAGIESRTPSRIEISLKRLPDFSSRETDRNEFLALLPSLDLVSVITVVFSLISLMLGYDLVCGEKESGMLRLLASYPIRRTELLASKMAARLGLVLCVLSLFLLASLLLLAVFPVQLSAEEWGRFAVFGLASALYLAIFFLLGAWISTLVGRSRDSLLLCTGAWVLLVVVVPQLTHIFFQHDWIRGPTHALNQKVREAHREYSSHIMRFYDLESKVDPGRPSWQSSALPSLSVTGASPELERLLVLENPVEEKAVLAVDLLVAQQRAVLRQSFQQARAFQLASLLSPAGAFVQLSESLMGTGSEAFEDFVRATFHYRTQLLSRVTEAIASGSERVFSAKGPLELDDLRAPRDSRGGSDRSARVVVFGLALLVLLCAGLALVTFWGFNHYDLR